MLFNRCVCASSCVLEEIILLLVRSTICLCWQNRGGHPAPTVHTNQKSRLCISYTHRMWHTSMPCQLLFTLQFYRLRRGHSLVPAPLAASAQLKSQFFHSPHQNPLNQPFCSGSFVLLAQASCSPKVRERAWSASVMATRQPAYPVTLLKPPFRGNRFGGSCSFGRFNEGTPGHFLQSSMLATLEEILIW